MALLAGARQGWRLLTRDTPQHRCCGARRFRFSRAAPLPLSRLSALDKEELALQEKLVNWQVRSNERQAGPVQNAAHAAVRAAATAFAKETLAPKVVATRAPATPQPPKSKEHGPSRGSGGSSARGPTAHPDSQPQMQHVPSGGWPPITEGSEVLGDQRGKRPGGSPGDSARCLRVNADRFDGKCARAHFSRFGTVDAIIAQGQGSLEVVFRSAQGLRRALRAHEQPRSVEGLGTVLHAEVARSPRSSSRASGKH